MRSLAVLLMITIGLYGAAGTSLGLAGLKNCKPVMNCRTNAKPCFVEVPQDDWAISFVGEDAADNPLRPKAAIRLRMCTGVDDVCQSGSQNQRFNWFVANQISGALPTGGQLSTDTGILDTGPYTEIGPHTFFGGSCLNGDEPCKIAWQYCELELPLSETAPALTGKNYKKPSDIARHLRTREGDFVRKHTLFGRY